MSLPWFRLYAEAVDDDKLRLLAFEDRWHFVAILCCKAQGIFDSSRDLALRKVGVKLGLSARELDEVARRLSEVGLIDQHTLEPLAWGKRQFVSDRDNTAAERQRRRRQKLTESTAKEHVTDVSRVTSRNSNGRVTRPDTDTDTDTESSGYGISNEIPTPVAETASGSRPNVPVQAVVDLYHRLLPMCPRVQKVTKARAGAIQARWRSGDLPDIETWGEYFRYVADSPFLTGRVDPAPGRTRFVADLEWLAKESNYAKVYEGKFHRSKA